MARSVRRPASDLREEPDIVSARPVLDDQVVFDPPDVLRSADVSQAWYADLWLDLRE
jgi:hypothetical protein